MATTIEAPVEAPPKAPAALRLADVQTFTAWVTTHGLQRRRRLLVSGSRDWSDDRAVELVRRELVAFQGRGKPPVLIEGEAKGIDTVARVVAQELGWPVAGFPALWNRRGRAAGMRRNEVMLACMPAQVLAFHPNIATSKGTRGCSVIAWELGLPVSIVDADGTVISHQRSAPKRSTAALATSC